MWYGAWLLGAGVQKAFDAGLLLAGALLMQGCGTINATVQDKSGRELMLLGHDPVAYFTMGKPMRGTFDRMIVWKRFARSM